MFNGSDDRNGLDDRLFLPRGAKLRRWLHSSTRPIDRVLGIACTGHGASLSLVTRDGLVRSSVLDRWAGIKHLLMFAEKEERDLRNPTSDIDRLVHFCLSYGYGKFPECRIFERTIEEWLGWFLADVKLRPSDIDLVVTSDSYFATCRSRLGLKLGRWFPRAYISNWVEHHSLHQRQAFWQSGFDEAAVLTLDSSGEPLQRLDGRMLAGTIAYMNTKGECDVKMEMLFPESSPGLLYEIVTRHCGFRLGDEGKTMGLAPYGSPELFDRLRPSLHLHDDGSFEFIPHEEFRGLLQEYVPERWPHGQWNQELHNVAYAGQALIEAIVTNAFRAAMRLTGQRNLAYAGGVALNSVANELAARAAGPESLYIAPNPGDTGQSLGCALLGAFEIARWPPFRKEIPEYLGRPYQEQEMEKAIRGCPFSVTRSQTVAADLARAIANGHITARFAGGAEFGPRALGNRSILCDARRPGMKDYLNERVKHREPFRPFAPAVLAESVSQWFELDERSAYMLRVVPVRAGVEDRIPAVVHVDGSCRVQTVAEADNPGLYAVIREFASLTGVPVVLNTSFNVAGKPIVESPGDAVACFTGTDIDVLAMGPFLMSKRPLGEYLARARD